MPGPSTVPPTGRRYWLHGLRPPAPPPSASRRPRLRRRRRGRGRPAPALGVPGLSRGQPRGPRRGGGAVHPALPGAQALCLPGLQPRHSRRPRPRGGRAGHRPGPAAPLAPGLLGGMQAPLTPPRTGRQNADSNRSTRPGRTDTTSNRTVSNRLPWPDNHWAAAARSRRRRRSSTASAGRPYAVDRRVFTSQNTTTPSRATTRSSSPDGQRQFRSMIR